MFLRKGWELPTVLSSTPCTNVEGPPHRLTLWRAAKLFFKYPEVNESAQKSRYEAAFTRIVEYFGKDFPVEDLWIPQIKEYLMIRSKEAAASTVNKEKVALSKMFSVLIELRHCENNPCRLVKNLSEKAGQREVYISNEDFHSIVSRLPSWAKPVIQTLYYTGMRRGEVVNLLRSQVDLKKRIISLGPANTEERDFKRVPISLELVPILSEAMRVRAFGSENVFLYQGRAFHEDSLRKSWLKALSELGIDPAPVMHDLRHSFVVNCRRSGVSHEIVQSIVGHWNRAKKVSERYGRISSQELVDAIDRVKWDFGETEIFVNKKNVNNSHF